MIFDSRARVGSCLFCFSLFVFLLFISTKNVDEVKNGGADAIIDDEGIEREKYGIRKLYSVRP